MLGPSSFEALISSIEFLSRRTGLRPCGAPATATTTFATGSVSRWRRARRGCPWFGSLESELIISDSSKSKSYSMTSPIPFLVVSPCSSSDVRGADGLKTEYLSYAERYFNSSYCSTFSLTMPSRTFSFLRIRSTLNSDLISF